jgi:hypothetical protein
MDKTFNQTPGTPGPGNGAPRASKPGIRAVCAAAALSLLGLAGCDQIDPLKRPYMWEATGVNARNIAAMAANPADLVHGRDTARRRVAMESDGVDRLWSGKALPLPTDMPGSAVGGAAGGGGGGGGGGAAPSSGGGS